MDVIRSHKRPVKNGVDYGFVGDVDRVDGHRLMTLISNGMTPVMAPLTHDGMGHILNTNADTIAAETAKALASEGCRVTLVYCFEKAGVLADPDDESSVIAAINHDEFVRLVANGTISGGMIPKITNALAAVDAGVDRVIITKAEAIGKEGGTVISR
jgi:acetylglutamate kinase